MGLTSPIPEDIREFLSEDPFMKDCVVANYNCTGKVEWHHAFTYAGKRVNAKWSILPLCKFHHDKVSHPHTAVLCKMNLRKRIRGLGAYDKFLSTYPKSTLFKFTS